MYYEFYLDVYFLENLIVNGLVLLFAGQIQKKRLSGLRVAASAVFGAAASCMMVLLPIRKNAAAATLLSFLLLLLMAHAAGSSRQGRCASVRSRQGGRAALAACVSAMLLTAVWRILMGSLNMPFFTAVPAGYLGVSILWRCGSRLQGRAQYLYDVTLRRGERQARLRGLLDSGNHLVQPGTARPVHIVDYDQIRELLDEQEQSELLRLLDMKADGEYSGKFMYIPYHCVGDSAGVLPAILLDEIYIRHGENAWSTKGALAAVSRQAVSGRGEYQMILHPRILE